MPWVAQGRRAYEIDCVRSLEQARVEVEVLRASLGLHVYAALLGGAHRRQCRGRRDVDDIDRRPRYLRQRGGVPDSLALEHGRTSPRVLDDACASRSQRLPPQLFDGAAVLAVQRDESPVPTGGPHKADDRRVVNLQAVWIGEVELEGGNPHLDSGGDDRFGHCLGEGEMKAPVDDRRLGPCAPGGDSRHRVVPAGHCHIVDDGRGPADGSGACPAHKIVRHSYRTYGHVKVGVGVDPSRDDEFPACVVFLLSGQRSKAAATSAIRPSADVRTSAGRSPPASTTTPPLISTTGSSLSERPAHRGRRPDS